MRQSMLLKLYGVYHCTSNEPMIKINNMKVGNNVIIWPVQTFLMII